jgi:hypothetical protein
LKKAQLYKREVEKGIKVEGMSGPQSTSQKTNSSHISPSGSSRIFMWHGLTWKKVSLDFPICKMIILTSKCS